MRLCVRGLAVFVTSLGFFSLALPALAHVRLTSPTPRYAETSNADADIKEGPCGRRNDSRTKDESRITTFRPGERIKVQFKETINHGGHFRIAFDDDGQDDFEDPTSFEDVQSEPELPILLDGIADKNGGSYEAYVTLPNIECTNCTLQLIQVMNDGGAFDPEDSMYYTCADIILEGEPVGSGGSAGEAGASGSDGSGGTSTATGGASSRGGSTGSGGSSSSAGGSSSKGGATSSAGGTSAGNTAAGARRGIQQPADEGGCSIASNAASNAIAELAAAAAVVMSLRRRRRR